MTSRSSSKLAAIPAVQLICAMSLSAQPRVNPQAEAMAHFSARVTADLALQKKVEGPLTRSGAGPGNIFDGAAEQFREISKEDSKDHSVRDAFAAMREVPKTTAPQVNADYPETVALATVPPLILKRLQRLPTVGR